MLYFLVNPASRGRRSMRLWKNIEKDLKQEMIVYQVIISQSHDDVLNMAKKLTSDEEEKTVVILGGDGTLNAFLNGMQTTKGIRLGYLPMGSGNDFARGMGITTKYKEEMNLILHDRQIRRVHYGILSYPSGRQKRFFVSSGIGYDARVCYCSDHSKVKRFLNLIGCGKLIYLFTGVRFLFNARTFSASLTIDDEEQHRGDDFLFASFHILPYEGGGFRFCPSARPEEDILHICVADGISKKKIPFIIPQAFVGTHIYHKGVYQYECASASIHVSEPQYVHTDGETDHLYDGISVRISDDRIEFLN